MYGKVHTAHSWEAPQSFCCSPEMTFVSCGLASWFEHHCVVHVMSLEGGGLRILLEDCKLNCFSDIILPCEQLLLLHGHCHEVIANRIYIYISCWNARGPRFSHFFSCEGAKQILEKTLPTAERSKWRAAREPQTTAAREPKNRCSYGGLPRSRRNFRAPSQLMKRFSPQNGQFGGPGLELRRSPRNFRAPSQFFAFRREKQILPKSSVSSLGSAERTRFKNVPKKWAKSLPPFRRKNDFSA